MASPVASELDRRRELREGRRMLNFLISLALIGGPDAGTENRALQFCQQMETAKLVVRCRAERGTNATNTDWAANAVWKAFFSIECPDAEGCSGVVAVFFNDPDLHRAEEVLARPESKAGPWRYLALRRQGIVYVRPNLETATGYRLREGILSLEVGDLNAPRR